MTSAPITLENGSRAVNRASRAQDCGSRVLSASRISALRKELANPRPIAIVAKLISEVTEQRIRKTAAEELQASVERLLNHAQAHAWSIRLLAKKTGLSRSGILRARSGNVDALAWLPKLEAALNRLHPS